ncbi:MAG TPA: MotA/TolQ/ExbB proton channel family protein [Polyangiaceae bacterium]|nr:MotA/TolQ/ExbB proton channel family protein [Polyangiaceae bacterium]
MLIHNLTKVALLGASWVMYLLIALSMVSIAIMLDRFLFFRKGAGNADKLAVDLVRKLRDGDRRGAEELLAKSKLIEAKIIKPSLDWIEGGPDAVSEVLEASMTRERKEFERGLTFLGTLGNNAPFVGLLGTVIGVIESFHQLGGAGQNHEAMGGVMSGISEALVATAVGLVVALPAVVGYNLAQKKVSEIEANVSIITRQMMALLKSNHKAAQELNALGEPLPLPMPLRSPSESKLQSAPSS